MHAVSHTSDHFELIEKYATQMVKQGIAYMDTTTQEEQQKGRFDRVDSPCRANSLEENLRLWKELRNGTEEGLTACLRAKMNMQDNNGSMRDPVIFRSNTTPHARTKTKYKAYPTYDLACPIVDSVEGVTHALRDRQYSDREPQYRWFLEKLKLRHVRIWGFSRINFVPSLNLP